MLMTLFTLLVFFSVPQVHELLPFTFNLEVISFYWFDLLTVGAFSYWIGLVLFTKTADSGFSLRINKMYLAFLLVGVVPILIGFMNGKGNLLYAYRFFFYFVWVPVIMRLLSKPQRAMNTLTYLIIINSASVVIALFTHFREVGFEIYYLSNYRELNLIVTMIMLSFFIIKVPLFGKKVDVLILILCMLAIIFDQSRKIHIAFLLGSFILYFNYKKIFKRKITIKKQFVAIILILILGMGFMGLGGKITERLGTIIVTPAQVQTGAVETSAFFRIYALIGGINLIKKHPFVGVGAGDAIEIQQWMRDGFGLKANVSPHNFYISAMLYYGIPIVLLVYYMIFKLISATLRDLQNTTLTLLTKQKIISLGMIAGFTAFMTEMFFEGFEVETIVGTWLFFGLMLGFTELHLTMTKENITHYNSK